MAIQMFFIIIAICFGQGVLSEADSKTDHLMRWTTGTFRTINQLYRQFGTIDLLLEEALQGLQLESPRFTFRGQKIDDLPSGYIGTSKDFEISSRPFHGMVRFLYWGKGYDVSEYNIHNDEEILYSPLSEFEVFHPEWSLYPILTEVGVRRPTEEDYEVIKPQIRPHCWPVNPLIGGEVSFNFLRQKVKAFNGDGETIEILKLDSITGRLSLRELQNLGWYEPTALSERDKFVIEIDEEYEEDEDF